MSFQLRQAFICSVCEQEITLEHRGSTASMAALFGAAKYAVCPSCHQSVDDHLNVVYRRRADGIYSRTTKIYAGVGRARFDR